MRQSLLPRSESALCRVEIYSGRINKRSDGDPRKGGGVKYASIAAQDEWFPLAEMCAVLDVSVSISGYRASKRGRSPDCQRLTDTQMLVLIRSIPAQLKSAYGSPRRVCELRARGFSAGKNRGERLMPDTGLTARHQRRDQVTTDSKPSLPVRISC